MADVAAAFGVSHSTVWSWVRSGRLVGEARVQLPAVKPPGLLNEAIRLSANDVLTFAEQTGLTANWNRLPLVRRLQLDLVTVEQAATEAEAVDVWVDESLAARLSPFYHHSRALLRKNRVDGLLNPAVRVRPLGRGVEYHLADVLSMPLRGHVNPVSTVSGREDER
jgi:transposase